MSATQIYVTIDGFNDGVSASDYANAYAVNVTYPVDDEGSEGNDFDADSGQIDLCVFERLMGRPVSDEDVGKTFKIEFVPTATEVNLG